MRLNGRLHSLAAGVNIEMIVANEAEQAHALIAGQFHGQARGRTDGGEHRDSRHRGLLHQFKTRAAADHQDGFVKRDHVFQKCPTDQFINRVVPADILADREQFAFGVEEPRGVETTRAVERRLRGSQPFGETENGRWIQNRRRMRRPKARGDADRLQRRLAAHAAT